MSKPAFFTDEDIYAAVAVALRKAGWMRSALPKWAGLANLTTRNSFGRLTKDGCW